MYSIVPINRLIDILLLYVFFLLNADIWSSIKHSINITILIIIENL